MFFGKIKKGKRKAVESQFSQSRVKNFLNHPPMAANIQDQLCSYFN